MKEPTVEVKSRINKLTGQERAAIFMLSLPEEVATLIFQQLDGSDIRELSFAMVSLGRIQADIVEGVLWEFVSHISSTGSLIGTLIGTERLLKKILPSEQVDMIMDEVRGPAGRSLWDKLSNVNDDVLANYLKNEYPQTIALVLSRIKPENAAKVMAALPENLSIDVVGRMLQMGVVRKEVVSDIEDTLRVEFMSNLERTSKRDSFSLVAEIFNSLDRTSEARLMAKFEKENEKSAEQIKALMFTFDDLIGVDQDSIRVLLSKTDKSQLALALKGVSVELQTKFFSCMTERAGKLLRDEMKESGAVRLRDVEKAQLQIINLAKNLADSGDMVLNQKKNKGDKFVA